MPGHVGTGLFRLSLWWNKQSEIGVNCVSLKGIKFAQTLVLIFLVISQKILMKLLNRARRFEHFSLRRRRLNVYR